MAEPPFTQAFRLTDPDLTKRPRERLASLGAKSLSNAELLAILLRTGVPGENSIQVGQRLLQTFGGLRGLNHISFAELVNQHGMGEAKAVQIKAAIEQGRRLALEIAGRTPDNKWPGRCRCASAVRDVIP